jgi:hypothetical protein
MTQLSSLDRHSRHGAWSLDNLGLRLALGLVTAGLEGWRTGFGRYLARRRLEPMPAHAPDGLAEPEWDRQIRRELTRITARRIF